MTGSKNVIIVGVDGTATGDQALRFAFAEAASTGDSIHVVTAWTTEPADVSPYMVYADPATIDECRDRAERGQIASVERVRADFPGIQVTRHVVRGSAGSVLVKAAEDARLLVVGSRSMGPIRAAILGSVSRYCARHASCPVVVVPAPAHTAARRAEPLPVGPQAIL